MKISRFLTAVLLSWVAIDLDLFREGARTSSHATELLLLNEDIVRKKKRILKKRVVNGAIPLWLRKAKPPVRSRVNHMNVKSRDPRDSDQRKIRRRFNNA